MKKVLNILSVFSVICALFSSCGNSAIPDSKITVGVYIDSIPDGRQLSVDIYFDDEKRGENIIVGTENNHRKIFSSAGEDISLYDSLTVSGSFSNGEIIEGFRIVHYFSDSLLVYDFNEYGYLKADTFGVVPYYHYIPYTNDSTAMQDSIK